MSGKIYPELEFNDQLFVVYWLDAEVNKSEHNKSVQKQLRKIVKHVITFDDPNQCRSMVESFNQQEPLVLIVSGRMGQTIVPEIHHLSQLSSIYVYCQDKTLHEQWAQQYFKVKSLSSLDCFIRNFSAD